ncbi:hypothetical protein C1I91_01985 [Clostridium manihotivorum]|uniref:Pre-toxin TG domain-containing protein n=2 Tax=Clostridium manihotivorum TaxID=2320868 RepID=A0A410DN61_9CLOT|nr:hypothetical protein C1I91_01985 [Clostridium manihotivorum]
MQAFVGHTTAIKDKVNIRDILGFGNISDNIKKQYEDSKALIEKYNAGLNTYNEKDYPSLLPGFAKKLWYNLTKKKEKTIDNYDDYLDAIIKSGDFNFETEGEKKLSIGLDFIPILGIEKMTLEGLLGEDLVSGKDLNGLERILAIASAGVGALAKVKNAIKLGEIGGKVEGSISFGMNGGGQLDNIISKLKQSKAEEDLVAKEAVTIDKGLSEAYTGGKTQAELDSLEYDPAKKAVTDGSKIEAVIGLELEGKGTLGRIERSLDPKAEFIDITTGKKIDVKSFESYPIGGDGKPITSAKKGAFKVENAIKNIVKEFEKNGNDIVVINKTKLTLQHIKELEEAIEKLGLKNKIIWWPE